MASPLKRKRGLDLSDAAVWHADYSAGWDGRPRTWASRLAVKVPRRPRRTLRPPCVRLAHRQSRFAGSKAAKSLAIGIASAIYLGRNIGTEVPYAT